MTTAIGSAVGCYRRYLGKYRHRFCMNNTARAMRRLTSCAYYAFYALPAWN